MAAGLLLGGASNGFAENLSGKVGDKRYPVRFPSGTTGNCPKTYKDYIAASGHSAYAQTPVDPMVDGFFCGLYYDARTKEEAEEGALKLCRELQKRYKFTVIKRCEIYASK